MTKIEITDELADSFGRAWFGSHGYDPENYRSRIKATLDATLNPPSEPEIVVTPEMVAAAQKVSECPMGYNWAHIYRAMRRLEPEQVKPGEYPSRLHFRRGEIATPRYHRRKGDK